MFDEIKKHPYVIGGAVLGIIVLFLLMSSRGQSGVIAGSVDSDSDVSAAEATAQTGIMANAQIQSQQIQLSGLKEQIGGAISLAQIQANTANNANELAAAVAAQQINAEHQSVDLANTLSAQTQQRYFQSTETLASINSNAMIQNTQAVANALTAQAQIAANVNMASIQAQKDVATQSWWDSIF
jgi:hypothetical protein